MIFRKKVQEAEASPASADIKKAVDAYVAATIANAVDLTFVREELAQVVGFELAQRLVNRIAVGRGERQVGRGGSYNAHAGVETR